jgi:hypothetical protein
MAILLLCLGGYCLACLWLATRFGQYLWRYWRFWTGQQRELYLMPSRKRTNLLISNFIGAISSLLWMIYPLFLLNINPDSEIWVCCAPVVGIFPSVLLGAIFYPFLNAPPWVTAFEARRSAADILHIQAKGRKLLQLHPKAFRTLIQSPEGWDLWVMTVV